SWFTARLLTEKGSGNPISEDAIFNTANAGSIEIKVSDFSKSLNNPDQSEIDPYFTNIIATLMTVRAWPIVIVMPSPMMTKLAYP
ncbi:MAG: hypothetical protein RLZZ148_2837, partial [Cyanobacteriota bacterium]